MPQPLESDSSFECIIVTVCLSYTPTQNENRATQIQINSAFSNLCIIYMKYIQYILAVLEFGVLGVGTTLAKKDIEIVETSFLKPGCICPALSCSALKCPTNDPLVRPRVLHVPLYLAQVPLWSV